MRVRHLAQPDKPSTEAVSRCSLTPRRSGSASRRCAVPPRVLTLYLQDKFARPAWSIANSKTAGQHRALSLHDSAATEPTPMFQSKVVLSEDCWSRACIDWKDSRETSTPTHLIMCSRGVLDWFVEPCGSDCCFTSDNLDSASFQACTHFLIIGVGLVRNVASF